MLNCIFIDIIRVLLNELRGIRGYAIMKNILMIIIGSSLVGFAYNWLLIPHSILSSGLSGIAIMLGLIYPFDTGILNFLLNLPLLILGVMKLGKRFVGYTILSVVAVSASLYLVPQMELTHEPLLAALFGGVITGVGIGIVFRASGSSGGFDIIAMILAKKTDFPIGALLSAMNAVIVVASGFIFGWDAALMTLVTIYVTGKVIDAIHTTHIKLTLTIITAKGEEMKNMLLENLYRGVTISDGVGAYSGEDRKILMTVITKYQLAELKDRIHQTDPDAFVNITQTTEVLGSFYKG